MEREKNIDKQEIVHRSEASKRDTGISVIDIYICVCDDGVMGLFAQKRVFDITYSMWVEVYEGLDSDRIAILCRSGDKVFPTENWLGKEACIVTKDKKIIRPNCSITNVIRGKEIVSSMREQGAILHFKTEKMSSSEMNQLLTYAYRQFKFENPKQKIKKRGENQNG